MFNKKQYSQNPRLLSIVEELKDGFCMIDQSGNFIYINLAAQEMMGINIKEKQYNFFGDVVKDEKFVKQIKDYLNQNDYIKDFEIDLFMDDDRKFPSLITINLIKDPSKKAIGMSLLIKDIISSAIIGMPPKCILPISS